MVVTLLRTRDTLNIVAYQLEVKSVEVDSIRDSHPEGSDLFQVSGNRTNTAKIMNKLLLIAAIVAATLAVFVQPSFRK